MARAPRGAALSPPIHGGPGGLRALVGAATCAAALTAQAGCGGGSPLLHGAHTLSPGRTAFAGGVSGHFALLDPDPGAPSQLLSDVGFGAGIAPYASGRVGIEGDNEAGLAYAGRTIRLDGRHAFTLSPDWALSLGLGGSAVLPRLRDEQGARDASAYGVGADLPLLVGWRSSADLYSFWLGPRLGFEVLSGDVIERQVDPRGRDELVGLDGTHFWAGGLVGFKVGFRHIHVAFEVDGAWHRGQGAIGTYRAQFQQVSVTPSGALIISM